MTIDRGLLDWVEEAMAPLGTVTHRAMMGGATLYLEGIVFAIMTRDGALWFKADSQSDAIWDEAGCARFSYDRDGTTATMNYRAAPADIYDDADAMREWAALAIAAGERAPKKRPRKK